MLPDLNHLTNPYSNQMMNPPGAFPGSHLAMLMDQYNKLNKEASPVKEASAHRGFHPYKRASSAHGTPMKGSASNVPDLYGNGLYNSTPPPNLQADFNSFYQQLGVPQHPYWNYPEVKQEVKQEVKEESPSASPWQNFYPPPAWLDSAASLQGQQQNVAALQAQQQSVAAFQAQQSVAALQAQQQSVAASLQAQQQNLYKSMIPTSMEHQFKHSMAMNPLFGLPPPSLAEVQASKPARRAAGTSACDCPNCQEAARLGPAGAHMIKKNIHSCHITGCGKVYSKTAHLRSHLRWHSGEKPFMCNWLFCGKRFTRSDELNRHMKIHTGEKNYECQVCNKKFMRSDHLKKHMTTHEARKTGSDGESERSSSDSERKSESTGCSDSGSLSGVDSRSSSPGEVPDQPVVCKPEAHHSTLDNVLQLCDIY